MEAKDLEHVIMPEELSLRDKVQIMESAVRAESSGNYSASEFRIEGIYKRMIELICER